MDPRDPQRVTISELARAIGSAREPTALYTAISEAAVRLLGATVARLWVNDPASGLLRAARLEIFEHAAPGLPPMLDIWRSSRD